MVFFRNSRRYISSETVQFPNVIDVFLRETPIDYGQVGSRVLQPHEAADEFTVESRLTRYLGS